MGIPSSKPEALGGAWLSGSEGVTKPLEPQAPSNVCCSFFDVENLEAIFTIPLRSLSLSFDRFCVGDDALGSVLCVISFGLWRFRSDACSRFLFRVMLKAQSIHRLN